MKLYAEYLLEREGKHLIEKDYGFCVYEIMDEYAYIAEIYILKDKRKKGLGKEFVKEVEEIAKEEGCKYLLSSFCLNANNWDISRKALKATGFKYFSKNKNNKMIYVMMEIN